MEENCGGGQGLNWAVEPRRESIIRAIKSSRTIWEPLNAMG
jgi:hypothetical protein